MNTFLCVISDVFLTSTIISNLNTTTTLLYRCCSKRIYIGCMPVIDILFPSLYNHSSGLPPAPDSDFPCSHQTLIPPLHRS